MNKKNTQLIVFMAGIFSGFVVFARPEIIAAAAPFEDTFEEATLGTEWTDNSSTANLSTAEAHSGAQSLLISYPAGGFARGTGTATAAGAFYFWVKEKVAGLTDFNLIASPIGYTMPSTCTITFAGNVSEFTCRSMTRSFDGSTWSQLGIEWSDPSDYGNNFRITADGGATWSDWFDDSGNVNFETILKINFQAQTDTEFYVDDVGNVDTSGTSPVVAGFYPILSPTTPVSATTTVVDMGSVVESGTITIPTNNTKNYTQLFIEYFKVNSYFPTHTDIIDLPNISAGDSYNYNATTSIPITVSGVNYFRVQYSTGGTLYFGSRADNEPFLESIFSDNINGMDTWVTDVAGGGTLPIGILNPAEYPAEEALEDCGGYSGVDAIFCNFRNWIVGAIYPSKEAIDQIGATARLFQEKWPMNYLSAIFETFDYIRSGVDDDLPRVLTFFGSSFSLDFSLFSQTIGTSTITIGDSIRSMFVFLAIGIFAAWAINYMHRIKEI